MSNKLVMSKKTVADSWTECSRGAIIRTSRTSEAMKKKMVGLVAWLAVCFVAAALGGLASASAGDFYLRLQRPVWAPPAWLFGPAWTVLYVLMGIAAWLVWKTQGLRAAKGPLALFLIQLACNALWTWIFFVWRSGSVAFAEILILWALILWTSAAFWRIRPLAGALLIPYLAWVTFAAALSYSVWQRNPILLS